MEPTPEQARELYFTCLWLTATLKCFIRLVQLLPDEKIVVVAQPQQQPNGRIFVYVKPNGERYVP